MLNSATMENICACFLKNPPKWRQCKLPIVLHIARLQRSLLKTKENENFIVQSFKNKLACRKTQTKTIVQVNLPDVTNVF